MIDILRAEGAGIEQQTATGQLFKFQIQCLSAFSRCKLFEVLPNSVIRIDLGVGGKAFRRDKTSLFSLGDLFGPPSNSENQFQSF